MPERESRNAMPPARNLRTPLPRPRRRRLPARHRSRHSRTRPARKPSPAGPPSAAGGRQPGELTDEEKKKVQALQERDHAVRAHEAAHKLAGGSYAGQPSFTTVKGPDGQSYAIGGEVPIDTSAVPNNPDATISKLETVIRAALAPSDPSAQDRQVAAEAQAKIQKAREQKQQNQEKELEKSKEAGGKAGPGSGANSGTHGAGPAGRAKSQPGRAREREPRHGAQPGRAVQSRRLIFGENPELPRRTPQADGLSAFTGRSRPRPPRSWPRRRRS